MMKEKNKVKEQPPVSTTYGVMGLMEWNALIPIGRSTLRVHFSGGTVTGYGVTPATFTTDNPAIKHLIETSYWFQSKKIVKIRV